MSTPQFFMISPDDVEDEDGIRQHLDKEKLQTLALCVREQGFKSPIIVARGKGKPYRKIDGGHRLAVALLLGIKELPAMLIDGPLSDAERLEHELVLNTLRSDLSPIEQAKAYQRIIDLTGEAKGKLAARLGIKPSCLSRGLPLLTLSSELQTAIHSGLVAADTGYKISQISEAGERQALEQRALAGILTRDEAADAHPRRRVRTAGASWRAKAEQVTLKLTEDRAYSYRGDDVSLKQFIVDLELTLRKARSALKRNLTIQQFSELLNAQAAAGGAI